MDDFEEICGNPETGDRLLMRKFGDAVEEICGNPETGGQASDEEIWGCF